MVDPALAHDGDGLKTTVGMGGKARHRMPVVHAPTVFARKVLPEVAPGQRGLGTEFGVATGVGVVVVHTKQEGV
jgi:hypothetical protein